MRVDGAFAGASNWNGVIAKGVVVTAPADSPRGIANGSASIAAVLEQIGGHALAVSNSSGGAVLRTGAGSS
jgi:hypothetical protein